MLSCLFLSVLLAAPTRAAELKLDQIVFHENLGDLDILAHTGGAEALSDLVDAVEARVNADGSFHKQDSSVLDVHLSSTAPPTATLRGGQTSRGARWALPALSGLPDMRLRAAALDLSLILRAPGGPAVKLDPVPWPDRLPADLGLARVLSNTIWD